MGKGIDVDELLIMLAKGYEAIETEMGEDGTVTKRRTKHIPAKIEAVKMLLEKPSEKNPYEFMTNEELLVEAEKLVEKLKKGLEES